MLKRITLIVMAVGMVFTLNAQSFKDSDPAEIALYPYQNQYRNLIDLSGIWQFKLDSINKGIEKGWQAGLDSCRQIAVPGSWNEQFTDLRDYLKWVWYEKTVHIPLSWKKERIFLRVNDATYAAKIWVNGKPVGRHEGCHVPFAFELTSKIRYGETNRISIQVENIQSPARVPTGDVSKSTFVNYPNANYDFFPYSGLNRAILLYSVPAQGYVKDVTVETDFIGNTGTMKILVNQSGNVSTGEITVSGFGQEIKERISFKEGVSRKFIEIPKVRLWSPEAPNLYNVTVSLIERDKIIDEYTLETGVRRVSVDEKRIYLNGEPIYLRGFGKHEDFPVIGRGRANPVMIKDFELMKWTGANSFRTTHYPYDKEFYKMADRLGFLVIGETPSVGLIMGGDSAELYQRQEVCKQYLKEMISRDKNHPSVIMWCVANEPNDKAELGMMSASSKEEKKKAYRLFKEHFDLARELDPSRLVMYVGPMMGPSYWFDLTDVIAINRYWGWYTTPGDVKTGSYVLSKELDRLHKKYNKPCMVTEFGADTYAGLHSLVPEMFSEEFQVEFIKSYLDVAKSKDFVTGMHIWNFADFKTSQFIIRMGGYNLKGVFTRERKPKMAAHYLRSRWFKENEE
jgi:beta-glucuronidase